MRGSKTKALKGQRPVMSFYWRGRSGWIICSQCGYPALAQKQDRDSLTYGELLEKIEELAKSPKLSDTANKRPRFNWSKAK